MFQTLWFSTICNFLRFEILKRKYSVRICGIFFFLPFSIFQRKRTSRKRICRIWFHHRLLRSFFVFSFFSLAKVAPRVTGVTSSMCAQVSSAIVSALHLRTLPQGLWVCSKTVFLQITQHLVAPISTLRTHSTLVAERVITHFVNSRFAVCANCTAAEDNCLFRAVARRRRDVFVP